jgi:hypothetical protein
VLSTTLKTMYTGIVVAYHCTDTYKPTRYNFILITFNFREYYENYNWEYKRAQH